MLRAYREVLTMPGARSFSAAGLIARLPMSTYGLGFVLLVSAETGRYGLAGAVTATYGLSAAVAAPLLARAVDQLGQARVLLPLATANAVGVVALVSAVRAGLATVVLIACAVAVGVTSPSVGSMVRSRWRHLLAGSDGLHTAFAVESVNDEFVFIVGPIAVTLLATRVDPAIAPLAIAAAALAGGWWLASQRSTEPPTDAVARAAGGRVLADPGLQVLAVTFLATGGIFGSCEVVAVAFTAERGVPGAAGLVLGAFALGSMLAGLAYGAVDWQGSRARRFVLAVGLLAAGTVPVALVTSVWLLAVALFLAGLAISPMVVAGLGLVEAIVAPARLTEGLSWCFTAITLGAAGGAAVCGPVIDSVGAHRAFLVATASGAMAAAVAVLGLRRLLPADEVAA